MKPSRYNHFYKVNENFSIAYNAFSNALAYIENYKLNHYYDYIDKKITIKDEQFLLDLQKGFFLIDDDLNELDLVRFNMYRSRFGSSTLNLTIAPTLDCNFRCIYCFQKKVHKNEYMTKKVQSSIIHFVKSKIKQIKELNIIWYGGEPLLALSVIKPLSQKLIKLCKDNNVVYSSSMITNGYLLTRDILKIINDLKIEFLQITIDGNPNEHNRKRPLKNGGHTFETILENLYNGYDLLPSVSLRINIDKNNIEEGKLVKEYLVKYNLLKKVKPYLGCIRNDNNCYSENECLSEEEFAKLELEFSINVDPQKIVKYPTSKFSYCCADNICSLVIAPDGTLYKCWSEIGINSKNVGNITLLDNNINTVLLEYVMFDPTKISPCKDCDILPICMGGCSFQRFSGNSVQCSRYKFVLERCLKNAIMISKQI
ncbi:radical SAM/SPASM domain-containing protein [Thomasclavelia cocleata]|uniref:radical SAM/SPASM domain-containing protein n=1 Tax=Thomasclavelia cocleata TaxID=69824 RepID=UPI00272E0088|nr:radical SAM protein [Thomasclavelia cocleata]